MTYKDELYRNRYNLGNEIVPDYVYDKIGLKTLEDEIGHGALVSHKYPMLSLPTHFFDTDNLTIEQLYGIGLNEQDDYTVSLKVDGISVSMPIENGKPLNLLSRGKRVSGYKLHNAFLQIIPELLETPTDDIEFRGEILLDTETFEEINKTVFDGKYANPRSLVSAMANSNHPNIEVVKQFTILWHGIQKQGSRKSHMNELLKYFHPDSLTYFWNFSSEKLVFGIQSLYKHMETYKFPCDGIVIENSLENTDNGSVHLDRIAIKQLDEAKYSGDTEIVDIEWRLAINGSYFPRLQFKPVEINGSTITFAAGYCYDYLIRMGLSIGANVRVTLHGGVIPYISNVITIGNGDLRLPSDIASIDENDIHIWSTNSEEAINRLRFIRGLGMLDLENCGPALFEELHEHGITSIIQLGKLIHRIGTANELHNHLVFIGFRDIKTTRNFAEQLYNRITTWNYVWCIMSLRIPGLGFKAANVAGMMISGYKVLPEFSRGSGKTAINAFLENTPLVLDVRAISNPVSLEHANGTEEFERTKITSGPQKPKAILSRRPTNGMTKAEFIHAYLNDYEIVENIKLADVLICPKGETSNKIKTAIASNITIKSYDDFL